MDVRAPAQNAILRVQSGVCQLFRESLYSQGFIEIHTPKLIEGESESGAGVFTTDHFGKTACLAVQICAKKVCGGRRDSKKELVIQLASSSSSVSRPNFLRGGNKTKHAWTTRLELARAEPN